MGWQPDAHGVSATAAMSASSMEEWRTSIAGWLEGPTPEPALVAISIVLDARVIYGPERGFDVPALLHEARPRPQLLRLILRLALARKPPTGFLRNIVVEHSGEHAGQFDIKRGGLLPVVNLARYAALAAEATTTSTVERLRAGADEGTLDATDAATLEEAFDLFSELRLEHQVRQLDAGREPDNSIDPKTLNPLTRRLPARCLPGGRLRAAVAEREARVEHLSGEAGRPTARRPTPTGTTPMPDPSTPWREAGLCVLDLETTGLVAPDDEIIAFATMPVDGGRARVRGAHSQPGAPAAHARRRTRSAIHGLRAEDLVGAPALSEVLDGLLVALTGRGAGRARRHARGAVFAPGDARDGT